MKLAKATAVAGASVLLSAAAAWAQSQGGCCRDGRKSEAKDSQEKAQAQPISFVVPVEGALPLGASITVTLRVNGADTALSLTYSSADGRHGHQIECSHRRPHPGGGPDLLQA